VNRRLSICLNSLRYTPIEVRPAVPGDIAVLTTLLELLFSVEEDFHFDEARQRKGLELMLNNPAGCILVAEDHGEVIGMCSGQTTISTAEGGPALLIEDVVVKSDRQGRNIGRQLLSELGNWAKKRGISRLQLLADRNNEHALGFYQKLGWQVTSLIALRKYMEISK
jgi:ribosomal protein S18 acetylase RimI-like enzyme